MAAKGEAKHWWNPDNLRDVAESVGISALNAEAVEALQQEVEYRVAMVITEAKRFMHAGKRTVLQTTDVAQALKVLEVEPLYGYESTRPLRFGEATLGPGQPLFYIEDEEVDFEKLINAPLPKVPRDMSFTAHWLAIEGVQPNIPQNPTTAETRSQELYPRGNVALSAMAGNETAGLKPMVKHIISKEQQAFFQSIVADLLNEDPEDEVDARRAAALATVRQSMGLQQLMPYFVSFISEKITHNVKSIFVTEQLMHLTHAIIDNESFHVQPYVVSLIPPITTAILADRPAADIGEAVTNDFELRALGSDLLGKICEKYDRTPEKSLTVRSIHTTMAAFTNHKMPLAIHYGAITAYTTLLPLEGIRNIFAPSLKTYEIVLERGKQEGHDLERERVISAIMMGLDRLAQDPPFMISNAMDDDVDMEDRREKLVAVVGPTIADRILSLSNDTLERVLLYNPAKALGF